MMSLYGVVVYGVVYRRHLQPLKEKKKNSLNFGVEWLQRTPLLVLYLKQYVKICPWY